MKCFSLATLLLATWWSQALGLPVDTLEVNSLIEVSRKEQWRDSYKSLNNADQALQLAQQIGFNKGIAIAHNLRGFCFWTFGDNELAIQSALDALAAIQAENHAASIKAESYYILARG